MDTKVSIERREPLSVGLVGDHNPSVVAHRAIPRALTLAAARLGVAVTPVWVATDSITDDRSPSAFDAIWCVPASPYRSTEGALRAIRVARENGIPFLGTCGGFQHAVLEYARNVLGWSGAEHAEVSPDAPDAIIAPLECALVDTMGSVVFSPGSRIAAAYGALRAEEGYHCSYAVNPRFRTRLFASTLHVTAEDDSGEVRAVELESHPFFVATLFQPERAALNDVCPPLVTALLAAAMSRVSGASDGR